MFSKTLTGPPLSRFWEGDATKHVSVKKWVLSEKGGGNSVNEGFVQDFYREGNSVKGSGRFSEPPDSEIWKVAVLIPFPKISSYPPTHRVPKPPSNKKEIPKRPKTPIIPKRYDPAQIEHPSEKWVLNFGRFYSKKIHFWVKRAHRERSGWGPTFSFVWQEKKQHFGFFSLECRKWGFKRWGFKEIRGYLRKKAFFLRFLDFPGVLQALRKRAKKAEKGRKSPISADFREGRPDTP